ncbi:hypothetical protein HJC23_012825 [Cyclotella cryptica]|uniref:Uncharacterized protein n=1 Tax=Cyclotella cryptica TaxID=29204 RepID=A0ABD3NZH4_9STRA|eukprot:CCRYP_018693-RA/>CCRYP_018693-RA protein AED:0.00 eAED:0.00 QI:269/-1/1/1/-1/1/1/214/977
MNSPRSKIDRHDEMTNVPGRKFPVQERGRTISRSRSRAPPSPERSLRSNKVDARDDASSAGTQLTARNVRIGHGHWKSSSGNSASENSFKRDLGSADERRVPSVSVSARPTKAQVELSSSASVASSYSRMQTSSPASVISALSNERSLLLGTKPSKTYADEYLRAAISSPGSKAIRKTALDSSVPFPSNATLSHSSYISEGGRDYDDPPEITSIPTDEIVDSFTRPTADNEEDANDNNVDETVMRGSRDQYTLGRLQARASKRRELLQQVPEEEDVTNFHLRTRASRIKHIRSLYLPLEVDSTQSTNPSKTTSPMAESPEQNSVVGESAVGTPGFSENCVNNLNHHSAVSHPTDDGCNNRSVMSLTLSSIECPRKNSDSNISAVGSPSNRSFKSNLSQDELQSTRLSPVGNSVGSPSTHSVNNSSEGTGRVISPNNRSVRRLSTIENSVGASNVSANNVSVVDSYCNPMTNASAAQSFSRKSTMTSSKSGTLSSDEMSEYRVKLFAKMLRLLDDVEHPGVYASSTRGSQNDERSYEYSVAELKLIQKRTEEEMSRIMNGFDRSKGNKIKVVNEKGGLNASSRCASIKESSRDPEFSSRSEDEKRPPPEKIMLSEAIASKLSDITSPTACQDGSGVYLDVSSNNYYCVIDNNEDELTESTPRNRPPRPSSPRKKKNPSVTTSVGKESLPIVQETPEFVMEYSNNEGLIDCEVDSPILKIALESQSIKSAESKSVPQCAADSNSTDVSLNTPDNNYVCERRGSHTALAKNVSKYSLERKQLTLKSFDDQVSESESVKRTQPSKYGYSEGIELNGVECKSEGLDEISEADEVCEPGTVDAAADEMMLHSEEGPLYNSVHNMTAVSQNEARDKLLAASRSAARRTVKKQRKQAEDRFHDGIMKAVSAAEEMQRLKDEVMDEVYETFDCDESPKINEEYSQGNDLLTEPAGEVKNEELYIDQPIEPEQLNSPEHEQCGCVIQ